MSKKRQRHTRQESHNDIVYGLHAVESLLLHSVDSVLKIFVVNNRDDKKIKNINNLAEKNGISMEPISRDKVEKRYAGIKHQGVIAQIRTSNQNKKQIEDLLGKEQSLVLILDGVEDPHNIGACLRTADAVGVDAVIVSKNRSPGITPVVRSVASGAAETVPFIAVSNIATVIRKLKEDAYWVVGAAGETKESIFGCHGDSKLALVMGAEGKGIRHLTRELCDEIVSIPMYGSVESLNVSVATGICLYELKRKML